MKNKHIPTDIRLQTPKQIAYTIAQRIKKERIVEEKTQQDIADISGVPYSAVVRFETTGVIQFVKLVQILRSLNKLHILDEISKYDPIVEKASLEKIKKRESRSVLKRVRK
jgi:transcriptional regulator with XRE-family HTH domain